MQQILNTLYVMTPNAYVHLENDTLRVDVEHEKRIQVPLHHLGSVVCFGNIMVSPALMHRLADDGKSLVLLDGNGRFKARVEGPVSGNILLRRAHHARAGEPVFALEIAKACVAGKVRNCRQVLLRGARGRRYRRRLKNSGSPYSAWNALPISMRCAVSKATRQSAISSVCRS